MDNFIVFLDHPITPSGVVSKQFLSLGIGTFHEACGHVHQLPYGYNSDRDDLMILFKEKMGSCTTKHAVISTLAGELGQKLGEPTSINEVQSGWWSSYGSWWGPRWGSAMAQNVIQEAGLSASTGDGSLAPGQININARVAVSFELAR